ncbi:GHMP kinase [Spirochaetia bacterium]|nr:GHMP kinase [Spirochaetia bacterium]
MIITRTPLRISFFGGGTDLPDWFQKHGGAVLSTTINKYLFITCRDLPPFFEFKNRFVYGGRTEAVSGIDEIEHPAIREVLRFMKIPYGIDMYYNADIPSRSGMGSSSAFTVGLLRALYGMLGKIISDRSLAQEAIHIEQDLIGEAVGCQDQIAAAFGGLNHIQFHKDGNFEVNPMTLTKQRFQELNDHLILVYTGVQRIASKIEAEKIKVMSSHTGELHDIRRYVDDAINILNGDTPIEEFGSLLNETWQRKRKLSAEVTNIKLDTMYETGRKNGAIGGKLLGTGGGGFMLFFVRPQDRERMLKSLPEFISVPFAFDSTGSQTIYYQEDRL